MKKKKCGFFLNLKGHKCPNIGNNRMNIEGFIEPHFQPVFSVLTKEVYAQEALLRFKGRDTLPVSLFKQWEKSGLVCAVDLAMIRSVKKAVQSPAGKRLNELTVGINISSRTVQEDPREFVDEAKKVLMAAKQVIIEITETYPVLDLQKFIHFAKMCRDSGIAIALDDCAPNSQFLDPVFLRMTRPDIIKVDGHFYHTCFERGAISPLGDIVKSAKIYRAKIVAEHVDCKEKLSFALRAGIMYAQGNYLGGPAPLRHSLDQIALPRRPRGR